jgi:hypothetical protein
MVMLDTMTEGRLIVGMLRGITNEMLTCDRREGAAGAGPLPAGGGIPAERRVASTLLELDQVAGEGRRPANVNRVLPINFCGGPNEIVAQLKQCRK